MPQFFDESVFGAVYGDSGVGKTADVIYAFPDALFIAQPGALRPWLNLIGLPNAPAYAPGIATIPQATALVRKEAASKKWTKVVIDDFSLAADATMSEADRLFPKGGHPMWGWVRDQLLDFRQACRDAGMHTFLTCHIRPPHQHEKRGYIRGGPMLPGTMPEDLPKSADMVLRVIREPSYPAWPFVYCADSRDTDWVQKDRHDLVPPMTRVAPMNLGEIMRHGFGTSGRFGIRRPKGLEWMDDVVEKIATKLQSAAFGSEEERGMLKQFAALVEQKHTKDPRHLRWVLRDSVARAALRREHGRNAVEAYFTTPAGPAGSL